MVREMLDPAVSAHLLAEAGQFHAGLPAIPEPACIRKNERLSAFCGRGMRPELRLERFRFNLVHIQRL